MTEAETYAIKAQEAQRLLKQQRPRVTITSQDDSVELTVLDDGKCGVHTAHRDDLRGWVPASHKAQLAPDAVAQACEFLNRYWGPSPPLDHRCDWEREALQYAVNAKFYRDIVAQIGALLGPTTRTADDGTVQDEVLALKVPDIVRTLVDTLQAIIDLNGRSRARLDALTVHSLSDVGQLAWCLELDSILKPAMALSLPRLPPPAP